MKSSHDIEISDLTPNDSIGSSADKTKALKMTKKINQLNALKIAKGAIPLRATPSVLAFIRAMDLTLDGADGSE